MKKDLKSYTRKLLQKAINNPNGDFRDGQWEAVSDVVSNKARIFLVQRTGWGKSIIYFLVTHLLREKGSGPSLLISPLLALMRNQLIAAERLGIRAVTINSSNREEWEEVKALLLDGQADILLVSPERLANDDFREEVLLPIASSLGLFVVDEAHCISDWGHDFRPDYRRIVRILNILPPNIPVLATTATANNRVVQDVLSQLGPNLKLMRGELARYSLKLQNIYLPSQAARMAWLAEQLPQIPGTGIIYVLTIKDAQRLAGWLQSQGLDVHAYWGGLETEQRENLEQRLLDNSVKALVATSALGMGFDKPDLGFVIHFQRPGSVVHYYQQVGRAGRALENAYGILLSGDEDEEITDYFISTAFPPEAHVDEVLGALNSADTGLSLTDLEKQLNLRRSQIEKVLKILAVESPSPVSKIGSRWNATPVDYHQDREKIDRITQIRYYEQERMKEYIQSSQCLMSFLRQELDDPEVNDCGCCAVCTGHPLLHETYSDEIANKAVQFLRRSDQVIEPRKRWQGDALGGYGWRGNIAPELRTEEGKALCIWGDAGWGRMVKQGKQQDGRFSDELVNGSMAMIKTRWKPDPKPEWVTCVPSSNHPNLVPDFAKRLAKKMGLPFIQCINKIKKTEYQKMMQNSYQQAHNLDGAFSVEIREIRKAPVLLVDDIVDSRWTMTVIGALLRENGSGVVFPFALSMASIQ